MFLGAAVVTVLAWAVVAAGGSALATIAGVPTTLLAAWAGMTWLRRERERARNFARVADAVERALRPMLSEGTGQPYRSLAAGGEETRRRRDAPRALGGRLMFLAAWEREVPLAAAEVLVHLRERVVQAGVVTVEGEEEGRLMLRVQRARGQFDVVVAARPTEQGCALQIGVLAYAGEIVLGAILVAWSVVIGLLLGGVGFMVGPILGTLVLGLFALAARNTARERQIVGEIVAQRVERSLAGLPGPAGQASADRALGTGDKGQP